MEQGHPAGATLHCHEYVLLRSWTPGTWVAKRHELTKVPAVIMYAALFMDWKQEHQPFDGVGLSLTWVTSYSKITTNTEIQTRKTIWNTLGFDYEPKSGGPRQKHNSEASPRAH